jgi:hypothetical protein
LTLKTPLTDGNSRNQDGGETSADLPQSKDPFIVKSTYDDLTHSTIKEYGQAFVHDLGPRRFVSGNG